MGDLMTPGFAKTRAELPYLYYPKADRVIINAHNFTPAGPDFSVNGKSPIAVWCPSLDTSGNGTSTVSDLVGTKPISLIASPTWTADTGSGGVRAIEFSNTNAQYGLAAGVGALTSGAAAMSISLWAKPLGSITSNKGVFGIWSGQGGNGNNQFALVWWSSSNLLFATVNSSGTQVNTASSGTLSVGTWYHIVVVITSTTQTIYINGASAGSASRTGVLRSTTEGATIGGYTGSNNGNQRIDDARLFLDELTSTDVSALYTRQRGG